MAFIQSSIPSPNVRNRLELSSFAGGLNNRSHNIEPNQSSDILNMEFLDKDVVQKRMGTKLEKEFGINEPILFYDQFDTYSDGTWEVVSTRLRTYFFRGAEELSFPVTSVTSGVTHMGRYYFSNGNKLYVFAKFATTANTYVKIIGVPIDGYTMLRVATPFEGFTPLNKDHKRGVEAVNYGENVIQYEPCEYELEDPYRGACVVPENIKYAVSRKGRLFTSGNQNDDDNIFISDVASPLYFPVSTALQVPPDSDKIIGLHVYGDSVIVGRNHDIYAISGDTNNPELGFDLFSLKKINTHTGFASHHAVDVVNNHLFYLGSDGFVYALLAPRAEETSLLTMIVSQSIDLFRSPINADREKLHESSSVFTDDVWYLKIGDKVLIYSYLYRAWSVYEFSWFNASSGIGVTPTFLYKRNDSVYYGRSDGKLYTTSDNYKDDIHPYLARWRSKTFDMEYPSNYKQFREFFLVTHTFDILSSDVRVLFNIDYDDVFVNNVIYNKKSIWGISKFGDRFISRDINSSSPFVIGKRGRNIAFTLENGSRVVKSVNQSSDLSVITNMKSFDCAYVRSEDAHYVLIDGVWTKASEEYINQPFRFYELNGEYEIKGKR